MQNTKKDAGCRESAGLPVCRFAGRGKMQKKVTSFEFRVARGRGVLQYAPTFIITS